MKFRSLESVFRYNDDCNEKQSTGLVSKAYIYTYISILVSLVKDVLRRSGYLNTMLFRTPHASRLRL